MIAIYMILWIPAIMCMLIAVLVLVDRLNMYKCHKPTTKEVLFDVGITIMPELLIAGFLFYLIFSL